MNETKWYIVIPDGSPGTLILTDVPPDEYRRRAGNYLPLLHEHHRARGNIEPGLYSSRIEHDDWCGLLKGEACDCSPVVISGPPIRKFNRAQRRRAARDGQRRPRGSS